MARIILTLQDNQVKKTYTKVQHTQQVQQSTNQPQSTAKKSMAKKSETATVAKAVPSPASKETQVKDHSHQATKSKADTDNQAAKAVAKPKETVINNGTVKPASNFNAEDDCDKLNRAINSGEGADESVVVAILSKRNNKQRQEIKKVYEQKYKKVCTIRIYHKCEGRIEKSVPRITVWHHEACRVMTNSDPEEQNFLSYPHMNNGFFSCSPGFFNLFVYLFILK